MPVKGVILAVVRARQFPSVAARVLACAWLALAGAAWALDPQLPPERYTVTRWTADEGLPHSQVHGITQTGDGFLWVTTWEGTARFDGLGFHEVDRLRHPDGRRLPSRLLWREADGSVLVGVDHLGLMRVPPSGEAGPACSQYPTLDATRVVRGIDGMPWLSTRDGLYRVRPGGHCDRVDTGDAFAGHLVLALLAHEDGSLWVGSRRGLFRWHAGRLEPMGAGLGLPTGEVRALEKTPDGAIWIAGDRGVWRLRGGRLERQRAERAEGLLLDRQGTLWVTATESRVLRYRDGRWEQLDERHGVRGHATGALFEDREGLVWFGTTHGLFRIADGPVWGIGRSQGLAADYIRSLLQTADGQVWIGHSGGLSRIRDGRPEPVFPGPGASGNSVMALAPAADGGVWAGTYNRGVMHVGRDPGAQPRFLSDGGGPLATEQVRALLEDPDGTLWIGTEHGLAAWRDGRFDPDPFPELPDLPVRVLHRTGAGVLWIGQVGGVARRNADGRLEVLAVEDAFPALSVFDVLSDADGSLWMATDRGVVGYRGGVFRLFGREHGLAGSSLFRILADGFDNLWMSGNHGVMRVPRASFHAIEQGLASRLDVQMFNRDDGMPSRQANGGSAPAGWRMDDGTLWLPTSGGVAVFDPARVVHEQGGDVPLVVDEVAVDGVVLPSRERHALHAGARLAIRYAGSSLRNPNGLRYRYRMHGFDRDWIEAGQAREAAYTNLPSGALRFEVQVARAPADWSRPASVAQVDFDVAPPWWARSWVALSAIAGVLLLFVAAHQWLGRGQRRRARRLEAEVVQRTGELREKNRELEDAFRQREQLMQELAHQATHDPLTGLPNRRASDSELASALRDATATDTPLSVAIIDIDRFKHINDRYGHQAGDQVLARLATQLQAALRDPAIFIGRNGGEEFLVVMRGIGLADATARLERVRREIAMLRVAPDGDADLSCTISIGVVERGGDEGADALLRRADLGLYAAKRQGRDRVVAG